MQVRPILCTISKRRAAFLGTSLKPSYIQRWAGRRHIPRLHWSTDVELKQMAVDRVAFSGTSCIFKYWTEKTITTHNYMYTAACWTKTNRQAKDKNTYTSPHTHTSNKHRKKKKRDHYKNVGLQIILTFQPVLCMTGEYDKTLKTPGIISISFRHLHV